LICCSCKYAIQPSGIPRHLKEIHHINRALKRRYIEHTSKFSLAEPESALKLPINIFPVQLLPIQDVFLCLFENCLHLCASSKRIQGHWTATHARPAQREMDWLAVPLQTFFRGNLVSYFTDPKIILHYGGNPRLRLFLSY
jgi:hypothetical protein